MAFSNGLRGIALGAGILVLGSGAAMAGPNLANDGSFSTCGTGSACTTSQLGYAAATAAGVSYAGYSGTNVVGWTNTSTYAYVVTASSLSGGTVTLPAVSVATSTGTGSISMYTFPTLSPDGGNFILQDADFNVPEGNGGVYNPEVTGGVSQNISGLQVGQIYQVGFYEAAAQQNGFYGSTTSGWNVTFGGTTQSSSTLSIAQGGFSGWMYNTLSFVATSSSELLSFVSTGSGAPPFIALDGVSVTAAVPEPSTWAVFGVALLGLGMAARRRFRRS
jgi:hypothetical protein